MQTFLEKIEGLGGVEIHLQEPMKKHTTFRTGGNADFYLVPSSVEDLEACIRICREEKMPYFIIGNGSNLLVSDEGFRGAVIEIGIPMSEMKVESEHIHAEAGIRLSNLAAGALAHSLTGLEFASGIPGTLGGAIFMNAGAYGGEMSQVVTRVYTLTQEGERHSYSRDEMAFGYRTSLIKTNGEIVVAADLQLQTGDADKIRQTMNELAEKRRAKQPLNFPSAGSTFKRPEGYFAGKLIQDAGLLGYQIGGACVSEKHGGFIINKDGASADDICRLICYVRECVKDKFGVTLEPEVRFLGFDEKSV